MVTAWTIENTVLLLLCACFSHYLTMAAAYSRHLATGLYETKHTPKHTNVSEQKFINYDIYLGKDMCVQRNDSKTHSCETSIHGQLPFVAQLI